MNSKEYAKNRGMVCPNCGSEHICGEGSLEADFGEAEQQCYCDDCDARWKDVYKLTGYEFLFTKK